MAAAILGLGLFSLSLTPGSRNIARALFRGDGKKKERKKKKSNSFLKPFHGTKRALNHCRGIPRCDVRNDL
jgi:hypothetical protein